MPRTNYTTLQTNSWWQSEGWVKGYEEGQKRQAGIKPCPMFDSMDDAVFFCAGDYVFACWVMRFAAAAGPHGVGAAERLPLQSHRAGPRTCRGAWRPAPIRSGAGAADGLRDVGRGPDDSGRSPSATSLRRRSPTSRSIRTCSRAWGRRSTPARACSSTARRATASRRWPSGSRCASARRSGFRTRSRRRPDHQVLRLGLPRSR